MSSVPPGDQPPAGGWQPPPTGGQQPQASPSWEQQPPAYQPPQAPDPSAGRGFTIGAFACAVIALIFLPPVFGIAGIALGSVGKSKGDPLGQTAVIVSAVCLALGMIIGVILLTSR
ncbi:MAG TPA: hypothetical protein VK988_11570 [Acidimicrobiales bacterium]|nr:hypothetical protein [Acidimicrobiales bacterium]